MCTVLVVTTSEASTRPLTIDFGGRGHTAPASIDCRERSPRHVSLPRSSPVMRPRRADRVLLIAAPDPGGGQRREFITADNARASGWHLPHWSHRKPNAGGGFRTHRAPPRGLRTVKSPTSRTMDDGAPADDAAEDLSSVEPSRESTTTRDPATADVPAVCIIPAPHPDAALVPPPPLDQSTPRAPPA
jgi:hypothetical protein